MFRGIAQFSMQGRWQAAIAITLISAAALLLPLFNYLAGGIIALCTLCMGPKEGVKIVLATTVIFTLLAGFLNQLSLSTMFLLSSWLPVLAVSLVLGYTRSLAVSFLIASGLGLILVLGFYLFINDPALWWKMLISPFFESIVEQPGWQLDQAQTNVLLDDLSSMMTGVVAASFSLNAILGLLIGRFWQSERVSSGSFANEFRQLKLGKPAALLCSVLIIIALTPLGEKASLLSACLSVMLMLFSLQGIAIVHAIVMQRQKHKFWLIAMYVLLVVMMPQMLVLLTALGILEQWFNFRQHSS